MQRLFAFFAATCSVAFVSTAPGCSDDAIPPDAGAEDSGARDTAVDAPGDAGSADDGGADAGPAPGLRAAFGACESAGAAGGLGSGMGLLRVDVDLSRYPEALCNDGSGAVFYVRRASSVAAANRWVIQLMGGGGCQTPEGCAARFCSVDTNFGAKQMSADYAPPVGGVSPGMMSRDPANPFSSWNHALLYYCSSDSWAGRNLDVDVVAESPMDPSQTRRYRIHFAGSHIVDAVVDTLRRSNGPVSYVDPSTMSSVDMPDLDDADTVVFAGASAGSSGVAFNVDRVAETLRDNNTACGGATCPLRVVAVHDSGYGAARERLDFSATALCADDGLCDWESFTRASDAAQRAFQNPRSDESCLTWHAENDPGNEWKCADDDYVLENHVTTPLFVRMDQTDSLLGPNTVTFGFADSTGTPIDLAGFAAIVRQQMMDLSTIQSTAAEGAAITVVPGAFSPSCGDHETLRNDAHYSDVLVDVGGTDYAFPEVLSNWATGGSPTVAISDGTSHTCP